MTYKQCSRLVSRPLLLFLILMVASTACAEWKEKVLYSFQGGTDGYQPAGGVVFDKQGNLYGVTTNGGSSSCRGPFQCGTVFQLKPPTKSGDPWTETVLYVFKGSDSNDGASPFGGLILDQAGNLYGTTGYDGTGDCILLGQPGGLRHGIRTVASDAKGWGMDRDRALQLQGRRRWPASGWRSGL